MKFDWKLGVSINVKRELYDCNAMEKIFSECSEAGIDCVEVSTSFCNDEVDYKNIYKYSKQYGVELNSFHLPFYTSEECGITFLDESIRKKAVERYLDYINKVADIGIKIAVIHSGVELAIFDMPKDRSPYVNASKQSFSEICEYAAKKDVVIAAENLPRGCIGRDINEMKDLLTADDRLRVCFDTNHSIFDHHIDFIKAIGDKIITTHVSDYDYMNERHWMPFDGKIDWLELCNALKDVGYKGAFLYEASRQAFKGEGSTIEQEKVTLADVRENYLAIMNGQTLPPRGKINKEECLKKAYIIK